MKSKEFVPWLRLEAASILAIVCFFFSAQHGNWWWFAALFLVPDLSMLGYLVDKKLGAVLYNLFHSYVSVAVVIGIAFSTNGGIMNSIWWVWPAHIAFDRMLGYGLKSATGFNHTHLGLIGPSR